MHTSAASNRKSFYLLHEGLYPIISIRIPTNSAGQFCISPLASFPQCHRHDLLPTHSQSRYVLEKARMLVRISMIRLEKQEGRKRRNLEDANNYGIVQYEQKLRNSFKEGQEMGNPLNRPSPYAQGPSHTPTLSHPPINAPVLKIFPNKHKNNRENAEDHHPCSHPSHPSIHHYPQDCEATPCAGP